MRIIAHLDIDAFFAAVEERNNPRFQGLPIVVGSDPRNGQGRGVVSTANYAARKFGIHSGQAISRAWRLAPTKTVWLPGNWPAYSRVSDSIMSILEEEVKTVQQVGADEAYFDLSFCPDYLAAAEVAEKIRKKIWTKEKLTVSIGIGPNKTVAKIASDYDKPNGLVIVPSEQVVDWLAPLPVRAVPGVGPKTEQQLAAQGVYKVADSWKLPAGHWLQEKAAGHGSTSLDNKHDVKSIGHEHTFRQDTHNQIELVEALLEMSEKSFARLKKKRYQGWQTTTVNVRFSNFARKTHSRTSKKPLTKLVELKQEALRLALPYFDQRKNPDKKDLRLIGVRLAKFS